MATYTWVQLSPVHNPGDRYAMGYTDYPTTGTPVVDIAADPSTWYFSTDDWLEDNSTPLFNDFGVSSRISTPSLCYDVIRDEVVLFGGWLPKPGIGNAGTVNKTLVWDGTSWTQKFPALSPPVRQGHMLAWCDALSKSVCFGGRTSGSTYLNDTWTWDGTDWAQLSPATSPTVRQNQCQYGSRYGNGCLIFGGIDNTFTLTDATWFFDGTDWAEQSPVHSPSARWESGMCLADWDSNVYLFGGQTNTSQLNDVWMWDGADWTEITVEGTPPSARFAMSFSFDYVNDWILMYGGRSASDPTNDETWALTRTEDPPPPATPVVSISHIFGLGE